jgi:hypothetical protein
MLTATKIQQLAPFSTRKKVALPKILANHINSSKFRGKIRERLVMFFFTVIRNQVKTGRNIHEYVPLPVTYLKKILGENYHNAIAQAKELGILEVNDHYFFYTDGRKGKCKSYRINQTMFGEDAIELVEYGEELAVPTYTESETIELLRGASFGYDGSMLRMQQWIANQEYMAKISVDGKISTDITAALVKIDGNNHKFINMGKASKIAEKKGQKLFQQGKKVRMSTEAKFHKDKANDIRESWTKAIDDIMAGNIYATIGANGRLFSNISSLPTPLLSFIKIEGENLASIDVKNCQMMIMGKWIRDKMKEEPDGGNSSVLSKQRFADFASTGKIYELVQEIAGLETRSEAKVATFRALYSSHRSKSKVKTALTQEFPGLVEYLDALKKQHGKAFLANEMQKMESGIMVNRILHDLLSMGYKVFSKHDSILCKHSQVEEVREIMTKMLNELVGEHRLEVEYYGN